MPVAGEWLWARWETSRVWHRVQWISGRAGVKPPPCGMRAPAWIRWMRGGEPDAEAGELCRTCRQLTSVGDAALDKVPA